MAQYDPQRSADVEKAPYATSESTVTIHEGEESGSSWVAVVDITGEVELLGGTLGYWSGHGVRITVDGSVIYETGTSSYTQGSTGDGTSISPLVVTPAKASDSLKVEVNADGVQLGYMIQTI